MSQDKIISVLVDRFKKRIEGRNWNPKYRPFKLVFRMAAPICLTYPWIYFDGLVSHVLFREGMGEDFFLLPHDLPFSRLLRGVKTPPQPIKRWRGIPCCSASIFACDDLYLEHIHKRFEDRWPASSKKKGKIYLASGHFRNYRVQQIYVPTPTVTFYLSADRAGIESVLEQVTALGDDTRIGWGAVAGWDLTETERDWSIVADGIAMRPIPVTECRSQDDSELMAWRSPYWASENVVRCAPPGAKVKLL